MRKLKVRQILREFQTPDKNITIFLQRDEERNMYIQLEGAPFETGYLLTGTRAENYKSWNNFKINTSSGPLDRLREIKESLDSITEEELEEFRNE